WWCGAEDLPGVVGAPTLVLVPGDEAGDTGLGHQADPGTVLSRQCPVPGELGVQAAQRGCGEQVGAPAQPAHHLPGWCRVGGCGVAGGGGHGPEDTSNGDCGKPTKRRWWPGSLRQVAASGAQAGPGAPGAGAGCPRALSVRGPIAAESVPRSRPGI